MERVSLVQRARLGSATSEASGASRQPLNVATQDGVDLQELRSGLLHELPVLSEVLRCARRHRGSRTGARHDDRQGSASDAGEGPRTDELEHEVEKLVVLTAEARPIGAQIDAAKARLATALKAEEQLKERWTALEEQVKANQQEKTSAQASLEELTSKAKMELERGGDHNHLEAALEQILELIESTWPAGHQARTVLERSRSRSNDRSKKRNMRGYEVTRDRCHVEKEEEHGAEDGLDLSINFGDQEPSPVEDPTEWFAKMQRLAQEDDVTIARAVRAHQSRAELGTDACLDRGSSHRQHAPAVGLDARIPGRRTEQRSRRVATHVRASGWHVLVRQAILSEEHGISARIWSLRKSENMHKLYRSADTPSATQH